MSFSRSAAAFVCVLAAAGPASAQPMETFVSALLEFTAAAAGARGDEGPQLTASLEKMETGLAQWDAVLAKMEAGLAADVKSAPPPVAARMRAALAAAYVERGRRTDALRELDAASKLDPQFTPGHLLRAVVLEAANRQREASDAFLLAWRHGPHAGTAYRLLTAASDENGSRVPQADVQKALATLVAAIDGASDSTAALGPALVSISLLDESSVTAPVFVPAPYADGVALLAEGEYGKAVDSFRAAAAVDPLVTDPALQAAEVKASLAVLEAGSARAALPALEAAVRRWPQSPEAHRVLGIAYRAAGEHDRSLEALDTAIRLNPNDERARLALVDTLMSAGDAPRALEALRGAAEAVPRSGEIQWQLGRLNQTAGDEEAALAAFERAAEIGAVLGIAHVHAVVGRLRHNQLDFDGAAAAYARRIDVTPRQASAHYDLAEIYRARDDQDRALAEYALAALLDSSNARAFAAVGQFHASSGRDAEAVAALRKAVILDEGNLEARYALSRALMRIGRTEEGRQELEIYQALQAKAMAEERRRFEENSRKIEDALKAGETQGQVR